MPFAVSDMTRQGTSNGVVATAAAAVVGTVVIVMHRGDIITMVALNSQSSLHEGRYLAVSIGSVGAKPPYLC